MKYETSAGGVIVAAKDKKLLVLLLQDKKGEWTFPKGLIERGENREKTAEREIAEEVGIKKLTLIASLPPVEYFYKWEGALIKKKVYYYIFRNGGEEKLIPQRDEGIMDVRWFSLAEAAKVIGYKKTNVPVLKEAIEKLNQQKSPLFKRGQRGVIFSESK